MVDKLSLKNAVLIATIFITLGLAAIFGLLVTQTQRQTKKEVATITSPPPAPTPLPTPGISSCWIYQNQDGGYEICLPRNWKLTHEEGPEEASLSRSEFETQNFRGKRKTTQKAADLWDIDSGMKLTINVSRLKEGDFITNFETLKRFWEEQEQGHLVKEKKEITISGQRALYHILGDPKIGSLIDAHFVKDKKEYLIRFAYNQKVAEAAKETFQSLIESFRFLKDKELSFKIILPVEGVAVELPTLVVGVNQEGYFTRGEQVEFFAKHQDLGIEKSLGIGQKGAGRGEYQVIWEGGPEFPSGAWEIYAVIFYPDSSAAQVSPILTTLP